MLCTSALRVPQKGRHITRSREQHFSSENFGGLGLRKWWRRLRYVLWLWNQPKRRGCRNKIKKYNARYYKLMKNIRLIVIVFVCYGDCCQVCWSRTVVEMTLKQVPFSSWWKKRLSPCPGIMVRPRTQIPRIELVWFLELGFLEVVMQEVSRKALPGDF